MAIINVKNENDFSEFIGQIVDIFEDYLSEYGFEDELVNPERKEVVESLWYGLEDKAEAQEEIDCLAVIYGSFYDIIGDQVWYLSEQFDSMKLPFDEKAKMYRDTFVDGVIDGYKEMLEKGQNTREIPEEDWQELKNQVAKVYDNWVIGEHEPDLDNHDEIEDDR